MNLYPLTIKTIKYKYKDTCSKINNVLIYSLLLHMALGMGWDRPSFYQLMGVPEWAAPYIALSLPAMFIAIFITCFVGLSNIEVGQITFYEEYILINDGEMEKSIPVTTISDIYIWGVFFVLFQDIRNKIHIQTSEGEKKYYIKYSSSQYKQLNKIISGIRDRLT